MNQGSPDITIVISSFNRDDKVLQSLERLFEAGWEAIKQVELLLIDDGSPRPLAPLLEGLSGIPPQLSIRLITQPNAGIGATRNRGYREARSRYVIFLDDDILVYPDTIGKLYKVIVKGPGPVLFGNYPFISHDTSSLRWFAEKLYGYHTITEKEQFTRVNAITSGLLVVDKQRLPDQDHFYKDNLRVPAAEEYEIVARFARLGIPIYNATHISAIHNHHLTLSWLVNQQYKYGLATAEAFTKNAEIREMKKFAHLYKSLEKNGFMGGVKSVLSSRIGKSILKGYCILLNKIFPLQNHNTIFGILSSIWFLAGYKAGKKKFSS